MFKITKRKDNILQKYHFEADLTLSELSCLLDGVMMRARMNDGDNWQPRSLFYELSSAISQTTNPKGDHGQVLLSSSLDRGTMLRIIDTTEKKTK